MIGKKKRLLAATVGGGLTLAALLAGPLEAHPASSELVGVGHAQPKDPLVPVGTPASHPGYTSGNHLAAGLFETPVAQGSDRLENPTPAVPFYGYDGDGPMVPLAGDVQTTTHNVEATKTEPDKNTYLRLKGQHGADPDYNYGTHFLFQGHEGGSPGYITRVNLDADGEHRITLMATADTNGTALPTIDGSTWDPFAHRLLFTGEHGTSAANQQAGKPTDQRGGVWQSTLDVPATVQDLSGAFGRGGFEGIQNDSAGNVWFVEDTGGTTGTGPYVKAKQPNSFVYRFVPTHVGDLTAGKLEVLQVLSNRTHSPITFHPGNINGDISSTDTRDLHNYGGGFDTNWVTIHDTSIDGTAAFDANLAAKNHGGTPFKRPENGQFQPGTRFRKFLFDETGDTDAASGANGQFGGWGAIQQLTQSSPGSDHGRLRLFYKPDQAHTGLDNVAFLSKHEVVFVEDAGDTLHTQRNALDSGFVFDTNVDYSRPRALLPVRLLAEGRDASATVDSSLGAAGNGFQNDADNEITGMHVSNGDPGKGGVLGAQDPTPLRTDRSDNDRWRVFYTQQHGDNFTWEILKAPHQR
jgi:hypothetical protein